MKNPVLRWRRFRKDHHLTQTERQTNLGEHDLAVLYATRPRSAPLPLARGQGKTRQGLTVGAELAFGYVWNGGYDFEEKDLVFGWGRTGVASGLEAGKQYVLVVLLDP